MRSITSRARALPSCRGRTRCRTASTSRGPASSPFLTRLPATLLGLLALPNAAAAQSVTISTAQTSYGVFADDGRGSVTQQTLAPNSPIQADEWLLAGGAAAAAATIVTPTGFTTLRQLGVSLTEQGQTAGGGALAGTTTNQRAPLPHSLLLTIPAPVQGKLVAHYSGLSQGGAVAGIAVDVGDDGSVDWSATADAQYHVRELRLASTTALVVRVTTAGVCPGPTPSRYQHIAEVYYHPSSTRTIDSYGRGCGPSLRVAEFADLRGLDVIADGLHPQTTAVLVLGAQPLQIPLPGSSCVLWTRPAATLPVATDAIGSFWLKVPLPATLRGVAQLQALSLAGSTIAGLRATGAVQVDAR